MTLPVFAAAASLRVNTLFAAAAPVPAALLLPPAGGVVLFLPPEDPLAAIFAIVAGNAFWADLAIILLRGGLGRRESSL